MTTHTEDMAAMSAEVRDSLGMPASIVLLRAGSPTAAMNFATGQRALGYTEIPVAAVREDESGDYGADGAYRLNVAYIVDRAALDLAAGGTYRPSRADRVRDPNPGAAGVPGVSGGREMEVVSVSAVALGSAWRIVCRRSV